MLELVEYLAEGLEQISCYDERTDRLVALQVALGWPLPAPALLTTARLRHRRQTILPRACFTSRSCLEVGAVSLFQ